MAGGGGGPPPVGIGFGWGVDPPYLGPPGGGGARWGGGGGGPGPVQIRPFCTEHIGVHVGNNPRAASPCLAMHPSLQSWPNRPG